MIDEDNGPNSIIKEIGSSNYLGLPIIHKETKAQHRDLIYI